MTCSALLSELLASRQPPEVQTAAIETLARFDDARVASLLLQAWPGMSPKLRATATEALFARTAWIGAFLDAVEKGNVGRGDVDPARLDLLKTYPVAAVRERAAKIFASGLARRQDVVATYQEALHGRETATVARRSSKPTARRATASKGSASRSVPTSRRSATAAGSRCCSTSSTPTATSSRSF